MQKIIIYTLTLVFLSACTSFGQNTPQNKPKRTAGTYIDDKSAAVKITRQLKNDGLRSGNHINVTVYNAIALLTGEISTGKQKARATKSAYKIQGIRKVFNQLAISAPSSFASRLKDTTVTGLIKTALLRHPDVRGHKIKVITERGEAHLLGLVTNAEAAAASSTTKKIRGVRKVIRLFEIVE